MPFASYTPERALAAVQRLPGIAPMLRLIAQHTGLGYAAIAHVTPDSWTCCASLDPLGLGIGPGDTLDVRTTFCLDVALCQGPIAIDAASISPQYGSHPTPKTYGFESYVCVPVQVEGGAFFGTLFALDPRPAPVSRVEIVAMVQAYAELIGQMLDSEAAHDQQAAALKAEQALGLSREQFIAVVAHDLRNPLMSIATAAALLARYGEGPVERVAGRMQGSVRRMSELLDDWVDFARGRAGGELPVRMAPALDLGADLVAVVQELRDAHPAHRIHTDIDLPAIVDCDVLRLQQLLSNLLANAIAYGDPSQPIRVSAHLDGERAQLSVTNHGPVVPAEVISRLFDPFWRGETVNGRTSLGLGLYICKQIAQAHHGAIHVESADGQDTCFHVSWPNRHVPAPPPMPSPL